MVTQRDEVGLDHSFPSAQHCLAFHGPHAEGPCFLNCPFTWACTMSRRLAAGVTWGPPRNSPLLDSAEGLMPFSSQHSHEEIYTELQIRKGQIKRGGPLPWLDSPSTPTITCQQIVCKGTWRGLRDNDSFPRKHLVQ